MSQASNSPPPLPIPADQTAAQSVTPRSLQLEDVLHVLDSEISEIKSDKARNGWNLWVIVASASGLLWLLTGELRDVKPDWPNVIRLVIAGFLFFDGIRWLSISLQSNPKDKTAVRFHWSHYSFGTSRAQAILEIVRCLGVLLLAFLSHTLVWYIKIPLSLGYVLYVLVMLLVLILSFKPFPIANIRNKWSYVISWTPAICFIIALILVMRVVTLSIDQIADLRVSGLIIAVSYLLIMLSHMLRSSYAVSLLQDIRRSVAAGKIGLADAIHRAEIAVGGMQISDALRDDVVRILSLQDQLDELTKNALVTLDSIEHNLPSLGDDGEAAENKHQTINSLTAGYKFFLAERKKIFDEATARGTEFLKKVQKLLSVPQSLETTTEFIRILQSRVAVTDQYFNKLVEREAEVDQKMRLGSASEIKPNTN